MENSKSGIIIAIIGVIITVVVALWVKNKIFDVASEPENNDKTEEKENNDKTEEKENNDIYEPVDQYIQARIDNFENEIKVIYKIAQQQYIMDAFQLGSSGNAVYTNVCSSITGAALVKELEMTGSPNLKYYILIDYNGNVLNIKASNDTYSFEINGSNISIDNIDVENNNETSLQSYISIECPSSL